MRETQVRSATHEHEAQALEMQRVISNRLNFMTFEVIATIVSVS